MQKAHSLLGYLSSMRNGKLVLWCYLIWYVVTVTYHFDPTPTLWLNSVGISAVIGVALLLSVGARNLRDSDPWQTFRLFLMPFCVSSFSSLIKGKGYVLIFPRDLGQLALAVGLCSGFAAVVMTLRHLRLKDVAQLHQPTLR
jgi:hypothetical protein